MSEAARSAHLHQIVVRDDYKRRGHGTALMTELESRARNKGLVSVTLKIDPANNGAKTFYRALGYQVIDSKAGSSGDLEFWEKPIAPIKVVAVHQPNFLPNFGYFFKMAQADAYVFLDAVQLPRGRSFASRNKILTPSGPQWLTLPIKKPSKGSGGFMSYLDAEIADDSWAERVVSTLRGNYSRAPFFAPVMEAIEPKLEGTRLVDVNISLLGVVAGLLKIDSDIERQSQLPPASGKKSDLIAGLCRGLGGTHYLSGSGGGRAYNDAAIFATAGVTIRYSEPTPPEYPQVWSDEFVENLSIVDMLFNIGPERSSEFVRRDA